MNIAGLQKLSMVDYPGHLACTVFLGGCNLRCPFCHNSELVGPVDPVMGTDELLAFLGSREGLLDGVCVTGGEPCVHADLPELLCAIRERVDMDIKLDTNGLVPDVLEAALATGVVDYVAMDIKNDPERYATTCGVARVDMEALVRSLRAVAASGVDYELRCTVMEPDHDEASFAGIADFLHTSGLAPVPAFYLQPFVDRDTVPDHSLVPPSDELLRAAADILAPVCQSVRVRGR